MSPFTVSLVDARVSTAWLQVAMTEFSDNKDRKKQLESTQNFSKLKNDHGVEWSSRYGPGLERDGLASHRCDQPSRFRRQRRYTREVLSTFNRRISFFIELLKVAEKIGKQIAALKEAARQAGIPVVYVNDNFGKWKSDFHNVIEYVINENKPGRVLAELLQPQEDDCRFWRPFTFLLYSITF